jgi:tetratricopeptide (TPR) repeat protein
VIGAYTLVRLLGEGGMGEVWEAEQRHPIRRRVALKLLKLGLDSKAFLARFEIERQALAVMDHPNIARVFDAGADAHGRPYYVMELVTGTPLTRFADDHRLTTRQRLDLFVDICKAVQHAHQKAVIHRDLKPSNVLVTLQDDRPVPKIIDFGIAKALGRGLTDLTFVTEFGMPVGTPAYMSPEQWDSGSEDIDTRSDIYSLGVMLYELLVGLLPVEPSRLRAAGVAAALALRDTTPPAPSTRVSKPDTDQGAVARARRTDPRSLVRELRGDLDWITLKALDPDRSRRYETSHALAQDIMRYLRDEPVLARPPAAWYRFTRFVRRNRVGVGVSAAAALGVAAFTLMTIVQSRRVAAERDRARMESARAGALNSFLRRTIMSIDPLEGLGRDVTLLEALDSAAAELTRQRPEQPLVAAAIESAIGWAYYKLGSWERAEPLLRSSLVARATEPVSDSSDLAESVLHMAALHEARGRPDSAAALYPRAIAIMRQVVPRDDPDVAAALVRTGGFLRDRGDTAGARSAFIEAQGMFERARDSSGLAMVDSHVGLLEYNAGALDRALALFRRSTDYRRRRLGDHALVAEGLSNMGSVLEELRRPAEAESVYREALRIGTRELGPEHKAVTAFMNNLGLLLSAGPNKAEAERLLREALRIDEQVLGREHFDVGTDLVNLAKLLCATGNASEGAELARRAARIYTRDMGAESWPVAQARVTTGQCLTMTRRYAEAEGELLAGLRGLESALGPAHWRVDTARVRLRTLYVTWGKPEKAQAVGSTPKP